MTRVAVLGLGAMGSRIATRIAGAGNSVTVWNRTHIAASDLAFETEGLTAASSATEAVRDADVVVAMLADDEASRSVWVDGGVLDTLSEGAIVVEASTLSVAWTNELASLAAGSGAAFVAAPVVGSRPQAETGALLSIVGGDEAVADRLGPIVETYSGEVHLVPSPSDAATLKLAINGLFAAQVALFGEIAGMVEKSALPTTETFELLAALPITAPGLARIIGLYGERRFTPNFPVSLVAKDLRYLELAAEATGASAPLIHTAREVFDAGVDEAIGELDVSGIAARYLG